MSLTIPKTCMKSSHHILSGKNMKLQVQVEVTCGSWSWTSTSTSTSTFFYKFVWALNIRKAVWKLCKIFFFGIFSSCFTRLQSRKVLLFMGVECCAVKNAHDRASSSVRTYTISLCPSKKKKIYFPIYMSYSNHQWCIWKVYQRPIKSHNNISFQDRIIAFRNGIRSRSRTGY